MLDDAHCALTNFLANRAARCEHRRGRFTHAIAHQRFAALLPRFNGFGPRLQDVDLASGAVFTPLDVHRTTVMRLDG